MRWRVCVCFLVGFCGSSAFSYSHEIAGSINYLSSAGNTESKGENESSTDTNDSRLDTVLMYGYFATPLVEPIFEIRYRTRTSSLASFEETEKGTDFGMGFLFNIPVGDADDEAKDTKDAKEGKRKKAKEPWFIPYGGIILAQTRIDESKGTAEKLQYQTSELVTKLAFGMRLVVYPHVALATSVRAFYQHSQATAGATKTEGGSSNKLTIEANLLSISILL